MIEISLASLAFWAPVVALVISLILISIGVYILNRRDLELGAMIGVLPFLMGTAIGGVTLLMWFIYFLAHIHFTP